MKSQTTSGTLALAGRVALISGGGTGIGKSIALAFGQAGASVALCGRRLEPLEEVRAELEASGVKCAAFSCDVAHPEDCRRAVEGTLARFGALHILVNNAGIARAGALANTSDEDIAAILNTNMTGVALLAKYAYEALRAQREGPGASVLNIASSVANVPMKDFSVYSASKAAVVHFTRCLALEWAPQKIRVNCINPGVVDTPLHAALNPGVGAYSPEASKRAMDMFARMTPLGRVGRPEEIAAAALYLSGPDADWITGSVLTVDGGICLA